jgi:hypothetical protein
LIPEYADTLICQDCNQRMTIKPPSAFCQNCGFRIALSDLRPKKQLGVKGDGTDVLVQSETMVNSDDELPSYVTIISEQTLN